MAVGALDKLAPCSKTLRALFSVSEPMDLYFSRRRFLETSFYVPSDVTLSDGTRELEEVYSVSTTVRKHSILPDVTTIEYVGGLDEEKHHTVATIEWRWPSVEKSFIRMDGWDMPMRLSEFLVKEKAFNWCALVSLYIIHIDCGEGSDFKFTFGEDVLRWKMSPCKAPTVCALHPLYFASLTRALFSSSTLINARSLGLITTLTACVRVAKPCASSLDVFSLTQRFSQTKT